MEIIYTYRRADSVSQSKNPLIDLAEKRKEKFYFLFGEKEGKLNYEIKDAQKSEFLEIKVFNNEAKLSGIAWFFGPQKVYIEDIREMMVRSENQKVPMVLIAAEGTTSQGKKELKSKGIEIFKNIDVVEFNEKLSIKKKKEIIETKEIVVGEDISFSKLPDNSLMRVVKKRLQRREPDVINLKQVDEKDDEVMEIRAFSSDKQLIAVYRTVDKDTIGINILRKFFESVEEEELKGIPVVLIGKVKFNNNFKKEAEEMGIDLVSLENENDSKVELEQKKLNKRLIEGAIEIIEQRGFSLIDFNDEKYKNIFNGIDSLGSYLMAENDMKDTLLVLLPAEGIVRVATVREFKEQIDALEVKEGMLIALKRFTYTAEREAKDFGIAALKKNHPIFNIFSHYLVPEHEIMNKVEVDQMLEKYNAKLLQLPRIYEDDPGIVAVNGKVGDVIRIIRENGENFRLVVPRPEGGRTENTALVKMTDQRLQRLGNVKDNTENIEN